MEDSGFSEESARYLATMASGTLAMAAKIWMIPDTVKVVPHEPAFDTIGGFEVSVPALEAAARHARGRHITVLVSGTGQLGRPGVSTRGRFPGLDKAVTFVSSDFFHPDALVLAHEWGHTLNLGHTGLLDAFNLMNSVVPGRNLRPGQIRDARNYARTF